MTSNIDFTAALRDASHELINKRSVRDRDTLVGQLMEAAVTLVPAAVGGGISRTEERSVRSSHATTQVVYDLDQMQGRLNEGPCVSAADEPPADGVFLARDLAGDDAQRWPRFAPWAVQAGMRSILSVSLIGEAGGRRSALNLYSDQPDAFDVDAVTTASLFANHAGALLYGADHAAQLQMALASRDTIGQAKGILMERFKVTNDEAFEMLVTSSQQTNMKLTQVATWVSGEVEQQARDKPGHF